MVAKDEAMVCQPGDRGADRWDTHLLLRPNYRASLQAYPNENTETTKGDISKKLTMGTFLINFDIGVE